jgi:16S rRNA (guanine527-N7)-methyltransferase
VAHAESFVDALGEQPDGARLIDLGSGGGLPGLVLAERMPQIYITLIDRRQKRSDFLRQAVARLGFDHVTVVAGDVGDHARAVTSGATPPYAAVTARSFGPPASTLRTASSLLGRGGLIIISEPPDGERWDSALLEELGLGSVRLDRVRRFERFT